MAKKDIPTKLNESNDKHLQNATNIDNTSLISAVKDNDIDMVRFLLENGENPNAIDKNNQAALHYAASNPNDNILFAELLLKHGADIEIQDKYGWTSLMEAVSNNNINIVRYLLEKSADPNRRNNKDKTALHYAALNPNDSTLFVELLLKHGGDIEIQAIDGWTSLMGAVLFENINIVRYLLEKSADPNRKNNFEKTALHYAAYIHHENSLIVELLLKHGADIETQDKDGRTLLMEAVSNNNIKIVRYLLEQGADPNKVDKEGNTALHIDRTKSNVNQEIIELLSKYVKK